MQQKTASVTLKLRECMFVIVVHARTALSPCLTPPDPVLWNACLFSTSLTLLALIVTCTVTGTTYITIGHKYPM